MEDNTQALEVVCQHFKAAYSDDTIENLRRRLQKAYRRNSELNTEVFKARCQLASFKLLNIFLLDRWRELVQDLAALNSRIA